MHKYDDAGLHDHLLEANIVLHFLFNRSLQVHDLMAQTLVSCPSWHPIFPSVSRQFSFLRSVVFSRHSNFWPPWNSKVVFKVTLNINQSIKFSTSTSVTGMMCFKQFLNRLLYNKRVIIYISSRFTEKINCTLYSIWDYYHIYDWIHNGVCSNTVILSY